MFRKFAQNTLQWGVVVGAYTHGAVRVATNPWRETPRTITNHVIWLSDHSRWINAVENVTAPLWKD